VSSTSNTDTAKEKKEVQDHYAAERERNARERDSRDRVDKPSSSSQSLHSRISSSSSSRPSSKRPLDDSEPAEDHTASVPKAPTGPASKRRKSGGGVKGDDNIANLFTAGLRKNANAKRRGGVRTEGDVEREMERVERERERERR
jgi:hypothetical protein